MNKIIQIFKIKDFGRRILSRYFILVLVVGGLFVLGVNTTYANTYREQTDFSIIGAHSPDTNIIFYQFVGTGWTDGHFKARVKTKNLSEYPTLYYNIVRGVSSQGKYFLSKELLDTQNGIETWLYDFGEISGIDFNKEIAISIGYGHGIYNTVAVGSEIQTWQLCWAIGYQFMTCNEFNDIKTNWFQITNTGSFQINQPPFPSNLGQYKSDGITPIVEGSTTTESAITFKAIITDSDNDQVKLQVELRQFNEPFIGIDDGGILNSDFVDSGREVAIKREGLVNGRYHWRARAVDDKGGASAWQEFGIAGNVDFEVKLVPLYTQVESEYPSLIETQRWSKSTDLYGNGNYADCVDVQSNRSTIRRCGCAITSMVMLGRYYDIDIGIDNTNVDPANINSWLTNNKGYNNKGSLYWGKAIEYLGLIDNGIKKARLSLDYYNATSTFPIVGNYIASAKPAVVYSSKFGHYFVADNKLDTTYNIKDTVWYNTKTLNDTEGLANKIRGYNNNFDTANLFSYLETPRKITGSIYLYLASPAELLITDPQGRKLGRDPIINTNYDEIPNSNYTEEGLIVSSETPLDPSQIHKTKVVYITEPIDGNYSVQVIGIDSGGYTLGFLVYDQNGQSETSILEGNTAITNVQDFNLEYSNQSIQETEFSRIVNIDIKPGSYPNSINLKSKGVIPVAVLTNDFFNAKDVVIDSILFAGAKPLKGNFEDVDNDGDLDLILHFNTQSLQLSPTDTEAVLTAQLNNSTLIKGRDSVRIVIEQ